MAHYALLDENNIVTQVIVGNDESQSTDWEEHYGEVFNQACKRTSYNTIHNTHKDGGTPFRLNYAGIGYQYREDLDGFIPPQPHASWTLDEVNGKWDAPIPKPDDEQIYYWNETDQVWVLVTQES